MEQMLWQGLQWSWMMSRHSVPSLYTCKERFRECRRPPEIDVLKTQRAPSHELPQLLPYHSSSCWTRLDYHIAALRCEH